MLTNYTQFTREAQEFKRTRLESRKLEEQLKLEVESETAQEREKLKKAIDSYQKRLDQVLEAKKGQINRIEDYHDKMSSTLQKTFEAFQSTVEAIQKDTSITDDREKERKINKIAENITQSLFTKEEAEEFKKFAGSMVIVIPSDRLQMSRLHRPQISDRATGRTRVEYS